MYVCMHACMYVCMYVMYVRTYVRTYASTHVCMYACMHACMLIWSRQRRPPAKKAPPLLDVLPPLPDPQTETDRLVMASQHFCPCRALCHTMLDPAVLTLNQSTRRLLTAG